MKPELKKLLVLNLPYLLFVYLFAKCGQAYRLAAGVDASTKLLHLTNGISAAFANPLPSLHPFDLCVGVAGAVAVRLIVYSKGKNAKKYRKGEEYGSARWGTAKDIAPYIDPKFENNILLTQTERLTMTGRPKDPKTARNKNVLVIGGSGSGKTRFYVKPNLMQCFPTSDYPTSFVITDPKGTLVLETGQMFQRAGYRVKILNTINFSKSMKYNPFVYIHSEKDVLKLVNTLIANTKGEGEKSAEDFWVKSERLFYTALIGYIWYEAPAEEMNFTTLLEMINASEAREDDPEFQSPVDLMFERLEQKDPDHFAVRQYKKFLLSAGKTRSSILISCGARLAPFDIREVRELMEDDEMELDTIGDEKTVLFLIMSDTDTTFNFILAMLQSQLKWAEVRTKNIGLLLWGGVGTGKSFFAGCIANALMEQEISVRMTNFASILNDLSNSFSGRNDMVDRLCSYPLLIIDDFGIERGTEYALEQVYNIIDARYRSKKPLIVTTNLTLTDLKNPQDVAHARIYDRLRSMCSPICFAGENLRQQAAAQKTANMRALMKSTT